jgi:predicted dinucleotide-binding enzyme
MTTIGIIGSGNIGTALATQLLRAGHHVVLANSRGPASLTALVAELGEGASAGTAAEAAANEIVAIAVPWTAIPGAVAGLDWTGRIVIDATNPFAPPDFHVVDLGGRASGEVVAALVPGARLVKIANTLSAPILASDPNQAGGRRVLVYSGDDAEAKRTVAALFEAAGFALIDLGGLIDGGRRQDVPDGAFTGVNLIRLP